MHQSEVEISILMCNRSENVGMPGYATDGAAGMDLQADITETVTLHSGERRLFTCGFKMAIPRGYEAQVRPRSGLALKQGVSVVNSPGTIDSDYRGEVGVILINHGIEPVTIDPGMRIAQMVIAPVIRAVLKQAEVLDVTIRGEGGYGSTGVHTSKIVN